MSRPPVFSLQPVTPEDRPWLESLFLRVHADDFPLPPELVGPLLRGQFLAQDTHYRATWPDADRWLVVVDGARVGQVQVWRGEACWRVLDLSVDPPAQGQGLGGAVLERICAEAGRPVELSVQVGNPAERLYRRMGFALTEDGPTHRVLRWSPPG